MSGQTIPVTRRAFPNAWWGMALLIATEATLLLCMIATYFYLQSKSAHWPPPGIEHPKLALPLALTGALVATSVPMALAYSAAARGRLVPARWLIVFALAIQGAYLGVQIHELISEIDKVHATSTSYGSIYLTMIATHHAHVAIGILLSLGILARLMSGLTGYRLTGLRAIALYWHFVNAMAILVVLTQVSPSL
jgi:heme/copper-type cytochrome/quinol oxidase subunit 3